MGTAVEGQGDGLWERGIKDRGQAECSPDLLEGGSLRLFQKGLFQKGLFQKGLFQSREMWNLALCGAGSGACRGVVLFGEQGVDAGEDVAHGFRIGKKGDPEMIVVRHVETAAGS